MSRLKPDQYHNFADPTDCALCPHDCHIDRTGGETGFCHGSDKLSIASICAHRGEEPVISGPRGICNIFFNHCNMRCDFCQNYQISRAHEFGPASEMPLPEAVTRTKSILDQGARGVGFVSPSHCVPQMLMIINALKAMGIDTHYVYNTNGYDRQETIVSLENTIRVWLPDLKYMDEKLGRALSHVSNYPEIATTAIREMFRQVGADIHVDSDGYIQSGLVIRHLVLPGQIENSRAVLKWIATELSPSVHISLMSQYHPTARVAGHSDLGRTLHRDEYEEVVAEFERLGFYRGWVQELGSPWSYLPDFNRRHPFEE